MRHLLLLCLLFTACTAPPTKPVGKTLILPTPLGLPRLRVPADNPPTAETVALGKQLFESKLLSVDNSLACANCHNPQLAFTDQQPVSTGVRGQKGKRNAPTILNAAYNADQFWDGRARTLEDQASGPMMNSLEMGHSLEGVEQAINGNAEMMSLFRTAYGPRVKVTVNLMAKAIASYERTIVSGNSPFDKYVYGKQMDALSPAARRGMGVFTDAARGNCAVCHTIEETYALFSDQKFHNLGVGLNPAGELTDLGKEQGKFRTPILRNVALTAPYMHDGSLKTLKDVVDFYVGGGNANPYLDKEIKALSHLTKQEREDLVTFLESLTGDLPK
ncbi:MAG: c-type cytochrome [Bryobacteraceae bacterium]|nr:c-type cytochrome [Bryobacteraceae bacterium]